MTFTRIQSSTSHRQETLVFLPGWGFDGQVALYGAWPADVELLAPTQFCHAGLVTVLRDYLVERRLAKVALVGWSMGANLVWQFATAYPEMVSAVTMMAGRRHWPAHEIAAIKDDLAADLPKSMQGFYRKSFLGHKELYRRFVQEMEGDYLARLDRQELLAGLDYLAASPLVGQAPAGVRVRVVHGRKDVVAPFAERPQIAGAVEEVIDAAGHLLFAHSHSYLL